MDRIVRARSDSGETVFTITDENIVSPLTARPAVRILLSMSKKSLDVQQCMRIAAEGLLDVRSVRRAYDRLPVKGMTLARITAAARKLGLQLPPNDGRSK